jgi:diguanylate cyclase (GGDEF)-like protein
MIKKTQITLLLSSILLLGFIATSSVSYFVAHSALTQQIEESTLPLTSDNIYSEIQQDLLRPIYISSLMAQDTFLRDWVINGEQDAARIQRYLKEIKARYDTVTSFFVSNHSLNYYHPSGVVKQLQADDPQDAWYFRFRQKLENYEINIDRDTADLTLLTVFINYKTYDYQGNFIGATGVGLSILTVKELIEEYQIRYNREIFFADRLGNVTIHSPAYQGSKSLRDDPHLGRFATRILTSPSTSLQYKENGRNAYLSSRLVPEFGWYLVVKQVNDPSEQRLFRVFVGNLLTALLISAIVLSLAWYTLGKYQRRLEEMATTDKLTGLLNRQVMDSLFDQISNTQKRQGTPLSVMITDVDHFKQVNDRFGHLTGDRMLEAISELLRSNTREADALFRWGGEEFLILLPNCDLEHARGIAEKIRQAVTKVKLPSERGDVKVTLSFGLAQQREDESQNSFLSRADSALYEAKRAGRNRVEMDLGEV